MNKSYLIALNSLTFMCLAIFSSNIFAENKLYPSTLLYLDNATSHHVIVAEKSTHKLYIYKNNKSFPELIETLDMVTGKKTGNKIFEGDYRTPEGVYFLNSFITNEELVRRYGEGGKIYGVGAFVLDYPNPIDKSNKKTGGGIWLHSTNDETRIEKGLDSRGCFVIKNKKLQEISKYIELTKTPFISVHEQKFVNEEVWLSNRVEIKNLVNSWLESWITEDIESYMESFHKEKFNDRFRGKFAAYKKYKRAVFSQPGSPSINLSNLTILASDEYATASFVQQYSSRTINDTGYKVLYLKKDKFHNWKIAGEVWRKIINPEEYVAKFSPSMRFF